MWFVHIELCGPEFRKENARMTEAGFSPNLRLDSPKILEVIF